MMRRKVKTKATSEWLMVVWSGAAQPADGSGTKGELLPRYERKQLTADTIARVIPRKHRSAAQ